MESKIYASGDGVSWHLWKPCIPKRARNRIRYAQQPSTPTKFNQETCDRHKMTLIIVRLRDATLQLLIDLLGRFIFGSFALLAAIGFGAIFVVLAQANPANIGQSLLRYVFMDLCVIVVIFLIFATIKFWSTAKWVDRWLASFTMRAGVIIIGFAMAVMAVGIVKQLAGP